MQLGVVSNRLCVHVDLAWLRYAVVWLSVLGSGLSPVSVQCLSSGILPGTASKQCDSPLPLPLSEHRAI